MRHASGNSRPSSFWRVRCGTLVIDCNPGGGMDHLRALVVFLLAMVASLPAFAATKNYNSRENAENACEAERAGNSAWRCPISGSSILLQRYEGLYGFTTIKATFTFEPDGNCSPQDTAPDGQCIPRCKSASHLNADKTACVPDCPLRQSKDSSGACVADTPPTAGSAVPSNADNGRPGELGSDNSGVTSNQNLPGGTGCVGGWEFTYDGAVCTPPDGSGNYNCINYGSRYTGNTCESEEITPPAGSATQCLSPAVPNGSSCSCPAGYTAGSITVGTSTQLTCAPSTGTGTGTGGTGTGTGGTGTGTGGTGTGGTGTGTDNGGGGTDPGTGGTGTGGTGTGTGTDPGTGSYNSVDCGVPPICSGDAVQCGISLEAWRTHCKLGEIHQKGAYDALMDGVTPGGSAADIADGKKAKDGISWDVVEEFEKNRKTYLQFSSYCPGPMMVELMGGQSVTIDPSVLCSFGKFIKLIMHIMAYMFVARIIHKTMV